MLSSSSDLSGDETIEILSTLRLNSEGVVGPSISSPFMLAGFSSALITADSCSGSVLDPNSSVIATAAMMAMRSSVSAFSAVSSAAGVTEAAVTTVSLETHRGETVP